MQKRLPELDLPRMRKRHVPQLPSVACEEWIRRGDFAESQFADFATSDYSYCLDITHHVQLKKYQPTTVLRATL